MKTKWVFGFFLTCNLFCVWGAEQNQLVGTNQIIKEPVVISPKPLKYDYQLTDGNDPALAQAFDEYQKTGKAENIITSGFEMFAYGTGQQPIVATSPFQLTVISLEPGEKLTNISSGDPSDWSYSYAVSGKGPKQQVQVMVKPSFPNISTDLVITTNKRLYTIGLVSTMNQHYDRVIRFWYPTELNTMLENQELQSLSTTENNPTVGLLPNINVMDMNFDYKIQTGLFHHLPSWAPRQVFDDGTRTYIEFPNYIYNQDLPALFVQDNQQMELVNYQVKFPYFVVDKIFSKAVLVSGVGQDQTKVTIFNEKSD